MLYTLLCYNKEDVVWSWSKEEDAAVMARLSVVHEKLVREGKLGPSLRLLFDQNIPQPLLKHITGHELLHAYHAGWGDLVNDPNETWRTIRALTEILRLRRTGNWPPEPDRVKVPPPLRPARPAATRER